MLYKNVTGQKIGVFAYTASTGAAKTGDAAQITAYIYKDFDGGAAITDTNPTEMDATNGKGWYAFDLSQAETNANVLIIAPVSSTSGVVLDQVQVFTTASIDQTGDSYGVVTNATYGNAAIENLVDDIGVAGAGLTAIPWNAAWDAEVESEVDDALGGGTGTALTAIPWNAAWDAEVQSEATDALNAYDPPTNAEMEARTLVAASYFDPAADTVANVTTTGSVTNPVTVGAVNATGLKDFFDTDSGDTYAGSVAGSVVKEIADNAGGASLTPAQIWAYTIRTLTQSAAQIADIVSGSSITAYRGDTLVAALTGIGDITDYVSLDFTVKSSENDTDDNAIIRIRKNASGVDDGLLRLNGAAGTAALGSIAINSGALGNITITLEASATDDLIAGQGYFYDIQKITATAVSTKATGVFNVSPDITRLIV